MPATNGVRLLPALSLPLNGQGNVLADGAFPDKRSKVSSHSGVICTPFLEPTSNLVAVLREVASEKAGKGPFLRPDLEVVYVHHEAQRT
jgi:hypothetical protein